MILGLKPNIQNENGCILDPGGKVRIFLYHFYFVLIVGKVCEVLQNNSTVKIVHKYSGTLFLLSPSLSFLHLSSLMHF